MMTNDNLSEEVAAADATLALLESLLDDLWEARQLLSRIDHFLSVMRDQTPDARNVTARMLRTQIGAWREK